MNGYAKIFTSLFDGSLRGHPDEILVFIHLLCNSSCHGRVDVHFRKIADDTGLPLDRVKAAIEKLESPDPESRSPDQDGKRIVRADQHRAWGWDIVNHKKYRELCSDERYRVKTAERVRKHRNSANVTLRNVTETFHPASVDGTVGCTKEGGTGGTKLSTMACFQSYISKAYGRSGSSRWDYEEERLALEVINRDEWESELELILKFKKTAEFFPGSVIALLQGWNKTLDRARQTSTTSGNGKWWQKIAK